MGGLGPGNPLALGKHGLGLDTGAGIHQVVAEENLRRCSTRSTVLGHVVGTDVNSSGSGLLDELLLFGKNPQHYCLNARIKIGRFGATQAALMNQDLIGGDLIRMADRVMEALDAKYLIRPIHYEGMQRIEPLEIPEDGLREILYNAIYHKDYNGPDSQMRIFDDRITVWNQGTLPSGISPEDLFKPHDSHPRNRLIANAFYMAGFAEAWGRGFELISEAFREQGLEVPTLVEEQGGVRVIIKRELFYGIQQGGRIDPKNGTTAHQKGAFSISKDRAVFRPEWDQKWDQKEKPAENQRVTSGAGNKVYLGIIRCITGV